MTFGIEGPTDIKKRERSYVTSFSKKYGASVTFGKVGGAIIDDREIGIPFKAARLFSLVVCARWTRGVESYLVEALLIVALHYQFSLVLLISQLFGYRHVSILLLLFRCARRCLDGPVCGRLYHILSIQMCSGKLFLDISFPSLCIVCFPP